MIETRILFFGQRVILSCNGDCAHAWGLNWHGRKGKSAPEDAGIYEGGQPKPIDRVHNKWCARECERSKMRDDDTGQVQEGRQG